MPSRNSVTCLPSLHDDGILADQIDTADVAVEIDAHARPVQPCRDLLDMGRLAGAVIAGDHDAAVLGKAGENGERGGAIEAVIRIDIRHMRIDFGIGRHLEVAVDAEYLPDRHLHVGQTGGLLHFGHGGGRHQSSEVPGAPETRFAIWLRMGAWRNLSESNGRQKPAAQSKFRCVIIKIGAGPGFWKAALRITPHFRRADFGQPAASRASTALSTLVTSYVRSAANSGRTPAQEFCDFIHRSIDCVRLGTCVACLSRRCSSPRCWRPFRSWAR